MLSDSEKRRQYDLYGPMESQPSRPSRGRHGFYEHDPTHGFESDMTAEEIFNMFFGGGETHFHDFCRILREINYFFMIAGFPSQSVYVRRGRTSAHFQRHFHNAHHHTENTVREVCL